MTGFFDKKNACDITRRHPIATLTFSITLYQSWGYLMEFTVNSSNENL